MFVLILVIPFSSVLVSQDGACDVIITSEGVKQGNFSSPNYPQVCIRSSHRDMGVGDQAGLGK